MAVLEEKLRWRLDALKAAIQGLDELQEDAFTEEAFTEILHLSTSLHDVYGRKRCQWMETSNANR